LGATVIKVEGVEGGADLGDYTRTLAPHLFEALNAGKRGVALNLRSEQGRDVLKRLVKNADVLVEGNRPGSMARLGLDFDSLKTINPRLIYCSISGYGATGPYKGRAGHDLNYQSLAGLLGITGKEGQAPELTGYQPADGAGAMQAAMGIMAAVISRFNSGQGQFVDISLTEAVMPLGVAPISAALAGRGQARGEGFLDGGLPAYNIYTTKDNKYLTVGALEPHFWQKIVEVFKATPGCEGKYDTGEDIKTIFASKDQAEWLQIFAKTDVCLEAVMTPKEVFEHPQHQERGVFQAGDVSNPTAHIILGPRLSSNPIERLRKAPVLGQHTEDVLRDFGFEAAEVEKLVAAGSVQVASLPICAQNKPFRIKLEPGKEYWWCACGKSAKQPFCDGSHKGTKFTPVKHVAEDDSTFPFCGCKQSKKGVRCDGTHKNLK
jgi:alpha-methylacyl-CoA racemase